MGIKDRPFVGSWTENAKKVVRYTPDALVFINGDTGLNTETLGRRRIEIQPYVTQLSCDHGTTPGTASSSITLSFPARLGSAIFREGNSLLRLGLEVHVYLRGYYEVAGAVQLDRQQHDYEDVMANIPLDQDNEANNKKLAEASFVRPYYHAFHGVVTNFSYEYGGGFYTASLECTGMLHFWQYMDMSTNASLFGARPTGSQLRMSLVGHNFTGKSPFAVIWQLYRDSAGAAGGVAFALSASGNTQNPTRTGETTLFHQTQRYWERRFLQGMYRLRMFGANGAMFNSSTQAMLGRMSSAQVQNAISSDRIDAATSSDAARQGRDPLRFWSGDGRVDALANSTQFIMERIGGTATPNLAVESDEILLARRLSERSSMGLAVEQLEAYVNDISMYGQVNLFESSYESKLDIAIAAANAAGYEFYQDVDGDLVFKPPLFNMDTKPLPAYNVRAHEIISISYKENEPACTYFIMKAEAFRNINGLGLGGEWGVRGSFIDYKLVAQFGWRPGDWECALYSDGRSAFWGAVGKMAVQNKSMYSASLTIPMRPELRCGYPIYIEHIDSYYYIDNMSHSFMFGGQCITTLQLVARRRKFLPPGNMAASPNGGDMLSLDNPNREPVPLRKPIVENGKVTGVETIGFPNVVMALDMNNINPLAADLGLDAFDLSNPYTLNTMLFYCVRQQLMTFSEAPGVDLSNPTTWTNVTWGQEAQTLLQGTRGRAFQKVIDINDLFDQVADYGAQRQSVQDAIHNAHEAGNEPSDEVKRQAEQLQSDLITEWHSAYANDKEKPETTIFDVLAVVQNELNDGSSLESQRDDFRTQSSARILNVLGDRKATFTNASTPGYYRYYSSAAPNAADHAPSAYTFTPARVNGAPTEDNSHLIPDMEEAAVTQVDSEFHKRAEFKGSLEGLDWSQLSTSDAQLRQLQRGMLVPVEEGQNTPCRGFRIVKGRRDPSSPVLPTHQIHRLEFCKSPLAYNMLTPRGRRIPAYTLNSLRSKIIAHIERYLLDTTPTTTVAEAIQPFYDELSAVMNCPSANSIVAWGGVPGDENARPTAVERSTEHNRFFGLPVTHGLQAIFRIRSDRRTGTRARFPGSMKNLRNDDKPEIPPWGSVTNGQFWAGGFVEEDGRWSKAPTLGEQLVPDRQMKANWQGDWAAGIKHALHADGAAALGEYNLSDAASADFGKVPLNALPLVCSSFKRASCWDRRANGNKWPVETGEGYQTRHAKIAGIRTHLATKIAATLVTRVAEILGQWRGMFYYYYPAKYRGNDPLRGSDAIRSYMAFNDLVDALNQALGADITVDSSSSGMYVSAVSGLNRTYVVSAVFPVSDAGGYETIGNYAYGRGVDVMPAYGEGDSRSPFQQLMEQDPINYLGTFENQAGEQVAEQMIQFAESLMSESQSRDDRYRRLAELAISIQTSLPQAELQHFMNHPHIKIDWDKWNALDSIDRNAQAQSQSQAAPDNTIDTLGEGSSNPVFIDARTQVLMQQLMNSFTHGTVAPAAQNTAYTLADLTPFNVDTAATEEWVPHEAVYDDAIVNLPAYAAANFVTVSSGDTSSNWSPVEDYVKELMMNKAVDWALSQQALRGQREIPYSMPSADDLVNVFEPWSQMFGENSDDFWANQFSAVTDVRAEDGEGGGLLQEMDDLWTPIDEGIQNWKEDVAEYAGNVARSLNPF